jgi:hypothetical protein
MKKNTKAKIFALLIALAGCAKQDDSDPYKETRPRIAEMLR